MKLSDYYNFEFPMTPYFNSAYGDHAPQVKYRGEYINGNWYLKYMVKGNSPAFVPKDSWIGPGRRFLNWILTDDVEFIDYLYSLFVSVIPLTDKLEEMNYRDVKENKVRPKDEFYNEYIRIWSLVIGFGYPLDKALDEYLVKHPIDLQSMPIFGNSFVRDEEIDLKRIANEKDSKKMDDLLQEHAYKYSYVFSNYKGYHSVPLEYFRNRLNEVKNKDIPIEKPLTMHKPNNIEEWIGFLIYIRDERKRCNMIYNAMADRYLKNECERLHLSYEDATLLTPEEFEAQKNTGLRKFKGVRFMEVTNNGQIDLDENVWNGLITETEGTEIKGAIASKGKAIGKVKIILSRDDFHKMEKGDVLVTSMTRPDFAPVFHKCGAIVTNEGGVTSHASIISREMKIPCIIGTGNATYVLKDGDMVEVDAEKGIVKILK